MAEPFARRLLRKSVEFGLLSPGGAGRARVLMYHGIGDEGCHRVNIRHISARVFEDHLLMFNEHFHVVPLDALFRGERHPRKLTVALTFDDGLRNNLTHALPLLEKHKVPASFFITGANRCGLRILWGDLLDLAARHTDRALRIDGKAWRKNAAGRYAEEGSGTLLRDHIKQRGVWAPKQELYDQLADLIDGPLREDLPYWQLMSDDDLRALAEHPLATLGAHGWRHNDMGRIPLTDAREELRLSKNYLEELSGSDVKQLAWPDGSFSEATIDAAANLGFTQQLAVDYATKADSDDPWIIDRFGVYDFPVRYRWLRHLIAEGAAT